MKKEIYNFEFRKNIDEGFINVPYYLFIDKVNGDNFKKKFVIDLRAMNKEDVDILFNNFSNFQKQFGEKFCFDLEDKFRWNHEMMFLSKDLFGIKEVLSDYNYFVKKFINEEEFSKLFDSNKVINVQTVPILDKEIILNGVNLISGTLSNVKNDYLRILSKLLNTPHFDLYNNFSELEYIRETDIFKYYYKFLSGKSDVSVIRPVDYKIYIISIILAFGVLNKKTVIIDSINDIGFNLKNKIKLIDVFNDYSYNNGLVFSTPDDEIKSLVKRRVYNHNIIEL